MGKGIKGGSENYRMVNFFRFFFVDSDVLNSIKKSSGQNNITKTVFVFIDAMLKASWEVGLRWFYSGSPVTTVLRMMGYTTLES